MKHWKTHSGFHICPIAFGLRLDIEKTYFRINDDTKPNKMSMSKDMSTQKKLFKKNLVDVILWDFELKTQTTILG